MRLIGLIFLVATTLCSSVRAEEPIDHFTWPGAFSFPEDVQIKPSGKPGESLIVDTVSKSPFVRTATISNNDIPAIKATLDLARQSGVMVAIYAPPMDDDSVQIPIIRLNPENIQFKPVYGNWLAGFFVKNTWIEVRTKDNNTLIGYVCYGCSQGKIKDHIGRYRQTLARAAEAGTKVVEVNLTHDSEEILRLPPFEDKLYDPSHVVFQTFRFKGDDLPGGLQFFITDTDLREVTRVASMVTVSAATSSWLPDVIESPSNICFWPSLQSNGDYKVSYLPIDEANRENIMVKGVAVVDGIKSFAITGSAGRRLHFTDLVRNYLRVLARATRENRKILINLDRRKALQMIMVVSSTPIDG